MTAAARPMHDPAPHVDEAAGRRDRDQTGHDPGRQAERGRLALVNPLDQHPAEPRRGGGGLRGGEGRAGECRAIHRAAAVEAEPPEPQQPGAEQRQHHAVGVGDHLRVTRPLAEHEHARQPGHTRGDVDDRAAREVERTHLPEQPDGGSALLRGRDARVEPVERPDHVGQRAVHERHPQHHEHAEGPEANALGDGPADQGRGDDREHPLEHDVHVDRDVVSRQLRGRFDPLQEDEVPTPADQAAVLHAKEVELDGRWAEGQRVTDRDPVNADDRQRCHALHHGGEDVLAPHHAAVEEGQPRHHEQDERARGQHPGRVAPLLAGGCCRCRIAARLLGRFLDLLSALFQRGELVGRYLAVSRRESTGLALRIGSSFQGFIKLRSQFRGVRVGLELQVRERLFQIIHILGIHDPSRCGNLRPILGSLGWGEIRKQNRATKEEEESAIRSDRRDLISSPRCG